MPFALRARTIILSVFVVTAAIALRGLIYRFQEYESVIKHQASTYDLPQDLNTRGRRTPRSSDSSSALFINAYPTSYICI